MAKDVQLDMLYPPYIIRMLIPEDCDDPSSSNSGISGSQYSYRCNFCHFATSLRDMIIMHINDHIFKCSLCDYSTFMQHQLLDHKYDQHKRPHIRPYDLLAVSDRENAYSKYRKGKLKLTVTKSLRNSDSAMEKRLFEQLMSVDDFSKVPISTVSPSKIASEVTHHDKLQEDKPKRTFHDLILRPRKLLVTSCSRWPNKHVRSVRSVSESLIPNFVNSQHDFVQSYSATPFFSAIVPKQMTNALKSLTAYSDSKDAGVPQTAKMSSVVGQTQECTLDDKPLWQLSYTDIKQLNNRLFELKRWLSFRAEGENLNKEDFNEKYESVIQPVVMENNNYSSVCQEIVTPLESTMSSPKISTNNCTVSKTGRSKSLRTQKAGDLPSLERAFVHLHPTVSEHVKHPSGNTDEKTGVIPAVVTPSISSKRIAQGVCTRRRSSRSSVADGFFGKSPSQQAQDHTLIKKALQSLIQPPINSRARKLATRSLSFNDLSDTDRIPECLLNIQTTHCTPSPDKLSPNPSNTDLQEEEIHQISSANAVDAVAKIYHPVEVKVCDNNSCDNWGVVPKVSLCSSVGVRTRAKYERNSTFKQISPSYIDSQIAYNPSLTVVTKLDSIEKRTAVIGREDQRVYSAHQTESILPANSINLLPSVPISQSIISETIDNAYSYPLITEYVKLESVVKIDCLVKAIPGHTVITEPILQCPLVSTLTNYHLLHKVEDIDIRCVASHSEFTYTLHDALDAEPPLVQLFNTHHDTRCSPEYDPKLVEDVDISSVRTSSAEDISKAALYESAYSETSTDYQNSDEELDVESDVEKNSFVSIRRLVSTHCIDEDIVENMKLINESGDAVVNEGISLPHLQFLQKVHPRSSADGTEEDFLSVVSQSLIQHSKTRHAHSPSADTDVSLGQPVMFEARVAPEIVDVQSEICSTYLQASLSPVEHHKSELDKPQKINPQNLSSLKSRLQLAYQKGAMVKKPMLDSPTKLCNRDGKYSVGDKKIPSRSSSERTSKSKKSKKDSKHKKHKRKSKDNSGSSIPKLSLSKQSSPTICGQSSLERSSKSSLHKTTNKKQRKEMVSLEESLIFYAVPPTTIGKQSCSEHSPQLQATLSTKAVIVHPEPSRKKEQTSTINSKKRKTDDLIEQTKIKKIKLSSSAKSSNKLHGKKKKGSDCDLTKIPDLTKVPWSNETIKDICRCDMCDFISIEMSDLVEHKKEIHAVKNMAPTLAPCEYDPPVESNIQFKCTLCGFSNDKLKEIRRHISAEHDGKLKSCERVTHTRSETGFSLLVESVRVYR